MRLRGASATILPLTLLATACSGSDGDATDVSDATDAPSVSVEQTTAAGTVPDSDADDPVATTVPAPASTEAPTTTAAPTTTSTTTTLPPRGSTADDPAPVGNPEFDLVGYVKNGSTSDAHVFGMTELPVDEDETDPGACVAIVGVLTLVESATPAGAYADMPSVELLAGDEPLRDGISECDDDALRAAGFGQPTDAVLVPGAQFAFGQPVFIPEGTTPTAISIGTAGGSGGRFFEPTIVPALPAVPELATGVVPAELRSTAATETTPLRVEGALLDSESSFDVSIVGFTSTVAKEDRGVVGDCVTVLSTVKGVDSVGAIVNAFAIPDVSVLAGGRVVDDLAIGDCDEDAIEEAGWGSPVRAGVAPGNTYAIASSFVVPAGVQPSAIFVGEPTRPGESWGFEATVLDAIPTAPEREGINPELTLVAAGGSPTFEIEHLDTGWSGTIHGLVELSHNAQSARCYAIVGTFVRDGENEFGPPLGLIVDGALRGSGISLARCDAAALEAAGYLGENEAGAAADGVEVGFFETIFLPVDHGPIAGIVVGNAASADEVVYVDPVVLTEAPPAP